MLMPSSLRQPHFHGEISTLILALEVGLMLALEVGLMLALEVGLMLASPVKTRLNDLVLGGDYVGKFHPGEPGRDLSLVR